MCRFCLNLSFPISIVLIAITSGCGYGSRTVSTAGDNAALRFLPGQPFAVARFHSKNLRTSKLAALLPWEDWAWPSVVTQLEGWKADDVVLYVSKPDESADQRLREFERFDWAAAVRFSDADGIAALLESPAASQTTTLKIDRRECRRFPSGTFLPSKRLFGQLRFTDRAGADGDGIRVGKPLRRYIEGDTLSSMIFQFEQLSPSDLTGEHLIIGIRPSVFRTRMTAEETTRGKIVLQNPKTGLRSKPFPFRPRSGHVLHVKAPRRLKAENGADIDLFEDLVADRELEIVLTCDEFATYLGATRFEVFLPLNRFEYACLIDDHLLIAESPDALRSMLATRKPSSPLAGRLKKVEGVAYVVLHGEENASSDPAEYLVAGLGMDTEKYGVKGLEQLSASFQPQNDDAIRIAARYEDITAAREFQEQVEDSLKREENELRENIELLYEGHPHAMLVSYAFQGVSFSPKYLKHSKTLQRQVSDVIAKRTFADVMVSRVGREVTIRWKRPDHLLTPSEPVNQLLAALQESQARHLFLTEKYELHAQWFERSASRLTNSQTARFRQAHQLSYNSSVEFDRYVDRYDWVHRGLEVLLRDAEANPDRIDSLWMAARFLIDKIGQADERAHYTPLFAADEQLHEWLRTHITVEESEQQEEVEVWLVAHRLAEHCRRRVAEGAESRIPGVLLHSLPALTLARQAESLDEQGRGVKAAETWKRAQEQWLKLADLAIPWGDPETVTINDAPERPFDLDTLRKNPAVQARRWIDYDYWLARTRIEQLEEIREARRLEYQANQHFESAEFAAALPLYEAALQAVERQFPIQSETPPPLWYDFRNLARYRRCAKAVNAKAIAPELAELLDVIERAQPRHYFPLIDDLEFVDADGLAKPRQTE